MKDFYSPKARKVIRLAIYGFVILFSLYVLIKTRDNPSMKLLSEYPQVIDKGWYYFDQNGTRIDIEKLGTHVDTTQAENTIYHEVPYAPSNMYLGINTHHQDLHVYINDNLIYAYETPTTFKWLKSYRSFNHFVCIPYGSRGELKIVLTAKMRSSYGDVSPILYGMRMDISHQIIESNISIFMAGAVLVLSGILLFIFGITFFKKLGGKTTIIQLAKMLFWIGLWQTEESQLLQFIIGNQSIHWILEYVAQYGILFASYRFLDAIEPNKGRPSMRIMYYLYILGAVLPLLLQITGIAQLTATIKIHNGLYVLSFAYIIFLINTRKEFNQPKLLILFNVSMIATIILFVLSMLTDARMLRNAILSLGLTITFLMLTLIIYASTLVSFENLRQSQVYKRLAFTDVLTGAQNNTAWFTFVDKFSGNNELGTKYTLVMLDVNLLKVVNDTFGHLEGDKVIKSFHECIKFALGDISNIYRINADKFLCLATNTSDKKIERALVRLEELVANERSLKIQYSFAYGMYSFTPKTKDDFQQATIQADSAMRTMKAKQKGL